MAKERSKLQQLNSWRYLALGQIARASGMLLYMQEDGYITGGQLARMRAELQAARVAIDREYELRRKLIGVTPE